MPVRPQDEKSGGNNHRGNPQTGQGRHSTQGHMWDLQTDQRGESGSDDGQTDTHSTEGWRQTQDSVYACVHGEPTCLHAQ